MYSAYVEDAKNIGRKKQHFETVVTDSHANCGKSTMCGDRPLTQPRNFYWPTVEAFAQHEVKDVLAHELSLSEVRKIC